MSKAVYAGLFAVGLALLALTAGCGTTDKDNGCGCSACGCDDGCGCGESSGCGDGCGKGCGCVDGCGCDGCGCGGTTDASDAKHAANLMKQYRKWTKTNEKQFRSKPHKAMITNWVNATGAKTFRSGKGTFPAGSVIAKEGWKKGKLALVFFMEKRAGYDKDNANWWYGTVSVSGKVMNSGKVASCASCHAGADNDYVFGNP